MKRTLALVMISCSFMAFADHKPQSIDLLIKSFTDCDATFFSNISSYKNELTAYTPISLITENQSYIPVEDRTKNNKNYRQFIEPIEYNSLRITGYYDSVLNLEKYGDYYFWGFTFDNSLKEIQSELNFLSWAEMEKDLLYTANAKIHYSDDSLETWHENTNNMVGVKTVPSKGTTEKLLMLENSPSMTLLVCSMQGFFPPELLATIRPDFSSK